MKNLNTVFPFYYSGYSWDDLAQLDRSIEGNDQPKYIISFENDLLPFCIRREHNGDVGSLLIVEVFDLDDLTTPFMTVNNIMDNVLYSLGSVYDHLFFFGAQKPLPSSFPVGKNMFVKVTDAGSGVNEYYYSEVFTVRPEAEKSEYVKLEFGSDSGELNEILWGTDDLQFLQTVYLDSRFKVPSYLREDVGDKIDNLIVYEKQSVAKELKLVVLPVPEYVIDALITLPMFDLIQVTENGECWTPVQVSVKDPEWYEQLKGVAAKLEISLVKWVAIKKLSYKEMNCKCGTSGNTGNQSKTVTVTADTEETVTWTTPFLTANYECIVQVFNAAKEPVEVVRGAQTATYFKFTPLESGTAIVIATEA
jgi:hypothetical protein